MAVNINEYVLKSVHEQMPDNDVPVLVALSGGVDSIVAAHAISKLGYQVKCVYINHGLSANAVKWMMHCADFCKQLGVQFEAHEVTFDSSKNIEAGAREARYKVFSKVADDQYVLVTGHHRDDLVETFLLAAKRGSGVDGLASMCVKKTFGRTFHYRPMLDLSRAEIEEYATVNNLQWVVDESNVDQKYDRNFLRNTIIPLMETRWEGVRKTIARSAQLCSSTRGVLEELLVQKIDELTLEHPHGALNTQKLGDDSYSEELQFEIIRGWLKRQGVLKMPSLKQLREIKQAFLTSKTDRCPSFRIDNNLALRAYKGAMVVSYVSPNEVQLDEELSNYIDVTYPLVEIIKKFNPSTISTTCESKNVTIFWRGKSRKLRDVLHLLGVPSWLRDSIKLIYSDEKLVYVVGIGYLQSSTSD